MIQKIRFYLLKFAIPLQKLSSNLHPPKPKAKGYWFDEIQRKLEPGDILLSREDWQFTNLLIPGFYSHAAIWNGTAVVEALVSHTNKVVDAHLAEWVLSKDYIAVLRPHCSFEERSFAAKQADWFIGAPYDFSFSDGNQAWYCSEICYEAYRDTSWSKMFTVRETWGVPTIAPQDFKDAVKDGKLHLIAEFSP